MLPGEHTAITAEKSITQMSSFANYNFDQVSINKHQLFLVIRILARLRTFDCIWLTSPDCFFLCVPHKAHTIPVNILFCLLSSGITRSVSFSIIRCNEGAFGNFKMASSKYDVHFLPLKAMKYCETTEYY